jgi:sugar-specific transcriptional regulator TrmB
MEVADLFMLDEGEINVEKEEILNLLRRIGLTDYESRAYLGLVMRSHGTAEEVADVASIPRTSAYKVLESLRRRNMVLSQGGRPTVYYPVPPREVREKLLADAERALHKLERLQGILSDRGVPQLVYTIVGKERVLSKVGDMIDTAKSTLLISGPTLREVLQDSSGRISNAVRRGVTVKVVAEPNTKVPDDVEVVRKRDMVAIDVIVDSEQALLSSPDLSICGYTDNPFLVAHFEYFLNYSTPSNDVV